MAENCLPLWNFIELKKMVKKYTKKHSRYIGILSRWRLKISTFKYNTEFDIKYHY